MILLKISFCLECGLRMSTGAIYCPECGGKGREEVFSDGSIVFDWRDDKEWRKLASKTNSEADKGFFFLFCLPILITVLIGVLLISIR